MEALWRRQGFVYGKDLQRAEWLIDRAIRLKHPEAMHDRAWHLLEQENTANDGLDLLHAAADIGMQQATYLLARFLEEEVVTARDPVAAGLLFGERFYLPSTGTNIRRQRACNAGSGCRVIYDRNRSTPAGDRLSEVLGYAR